MLTGIGRDVVFGVRVFRRQPAIVTMTIAGLAIAIGVSTAVFGLVNALAWRTYGIADADAVFHVRLAAPSGHQAPWTAADYRRVEQSVSSLDVAATAWGPGSESFAADADADRDRLPTAIVLSVSGNYFHVLGARITIGRGLLPDDDRPGAAPVIVLGHRFWSQTLNGDRTIVGRTVWINHRPVVVVGVAAPGFTGPSFEAGQPAASAWLTLTAAGEAAQARETTRSRDLHARIAALRQKRSLEPAEQDRIEILTAALGYPVQPVATQPVRVIGRLEQAAPARAQAEVSAVVQALASERGQAVDTRPSVRLVSVSERPAASIMSVSIAAVLTGAVFLMFLACANLANVLVASAAARRHEIGTRLALGASRARLVRQLVTESLLLGVVGGAMGLLAGTWLLPLFARLLRFREGFDVSPDYVVFGAACAVTIVVSVLAGLAPAMHTRVVNVVPALKSGIAATGGLTSRRLRSILVGGQAAISVCLLVVSALLARGVIQASRFDHGFATDHLVFVSVWFGRGHLSSAARMDSYWDLAIQRIRQVPGVAAVSLAGDAPFDGTSAPSRLLSGRIVNRNSSRSDYFDVIGARMVRGRAYSEQEVRSGAAVAVISERVARDFWGETDPIGSDLSRVWGAGDQPDSRGHGSFARPPGTRVVGVVAETMNDLWDHNYPTIYIPISQDNLRGASLLVRAAGDPAAIVAPIRRLISELDPDVSVRKIAGIRDAVRADLRGPTSLTMFATIVSCAAVALAVMGLIGVTAFAVAQRRHEVGVRVALGAGHSAVVRLIAGASLRPVLVGLAGGLVGSLFAGQVVRSYLFGVGARDPIAIALAAAVLLSAATLAAVLPARQATRINPVELLRQS